MKPAKKHGFWRKQKGFALVATITLMMLLALLSVGLLTIASSQVRVSEKHLFAAEAKALAKFSLEVALGQLQCELGPDQRVSANAGILTEGEAESSSAHILGVWNSWDTWLNRNNSQGLGISSTYDKGRSSMFRRWLVSDPDFNRLSEIEAGNSMLGKKTKSNKTTKSVVLIGPGTLGTPANSARQDSKEVYARVVRVDDSSSSKGIRKKNTSRKYIAWWITGENQKARINLAPHASEEKTDEIAILRSTWDTPRPDLSPFNLESLVPQVSGENMDAMQKIFSLDSLLLNSKNGQLKDLGEVYHDVSLISSSLMTDSKFGGIKKDLNLLISQDRLPADFLDENKDIGLRPYTNEDGNPTEQNRPISSWNQLQLWANVWDQNAKREGQDATASLQWNGKSPTTLVAADADANLEMMDNRHTYMRQPILLRFYNFIGVHLDKYTPIGANGGHINTAYTVLPVMVWWNPYNVPLKLQDAAGGPWGSYFGEWRTMPMLTGNNIGNIAAALPLGDANGNPTMNTSEWPNEHPLTPYTFSHEARDRQIADFGAAFRKTSTLNSDGSINRGPASVMNPGEVIVYSLPASPIVNSHIYEGAVSKARAAHADIATDAFSFREGWPQNLGEMAGYAVNMYTGLKYNYFQGADVPSEWSNKVPTKVHIWTEFAVTDDQLVGHKRDKAKGTPPEHVLAHRYTTEFSDKSNKLRTFALGSGIMDSKTVGKSYGNAAKVTPDPTVFPKISPSIFNINWGFEEKLLNATALPCTGLVNNPPADKVNTEANAAGEWVQVEEGGPYPTFVSYFGISAKWSKAPLVGTYPMGKDYRAKTWQHSSPLFYGSQMAMPSELGRTYHPYQFEVRESHSAAFQITISNILSNEGTRLSPFGGPGAEQVNKIVAAELPFQQPASLAGFAGMRLTPGWYKSSSRAEVAKRFAYQSGVPGVGIGNSFADPMLPADKIFSHQEITGDAALGDFWDHGLMVNDALWDTWFASSLGRRPQSLGGAREDVEDVLKKAFDVDPTTGKVADIANRRFVPNLQGKPKETVINELAQADEGYKHAGKYLTIAGGFNVNSTSQRAWEATLLGLKKRKMLYTDSNGVANVLDNGESTAFSRFGVASNNQSHVDDFGVVGVIQGVPDGDAYAWSDLRKLSDAQIKDLAKNMVKEVKKRGPFLNLSDFVNRRLQTGEMGVKGALQAAIDASRLNSTFDEITDAQINPAADYPHKEAAQGSAYTAAPGYLIQSDVLAVLGNILTTRDDTFTVRAYGELADRNGNTLSRAWCEAIVQRGLHYVDPVDNPETPVTEVDMKSGELQATQLSPINRAFGRKFNVISFRWLSADEV